MDRSNVIVLVVLAALAVLVGVVHTMRGTPTGMGYYEIRPDGKKVSYDLQAVQKRVEIVEANDELSATQKTDQIAQIHTQFRFSWPRTIGIWLAAFFTLATFSFLYKDNPFYKIAEHAFVGISAAYWMVVAFWTTVVPNLLGKLFPRWTKMNFMPGLDIDETVTNLATTSWVQSGETWIGFVNYDAADGDGLTASAMQLMNVFYWTPMVLGIMLLWRLAPKGAWIARWPLAFILGTTAGIRLTGFLESDFMKQIQSTVLPLLQFAYDPTTGAVDIGKTFQESMNNILIIGGVMCGLVYFFFSLEHKGFVGRVSRVGIWVLMITFGAGFGYTVMGRVALLIGRFEFLVIDWLNVVER